MKKFVIIGALAAMTLVTAVPAEAFFVGVGPRGGVRVGVGGFGYGPRFGYGYGYRRFGYGRGFYGYRRGFYGRGFRRF